jgi:hypothetical protein
MLETKLKHTCFTAHKDKTVCVNKQNSLYGKYCDIHKKQNTTHCKKPVKSTKQTPSQTAKGGYTAERNVVIKINEQYKQDIDDFIGYDCGIFSQKKGKTKTDIESKNDSGRKTNLQVKKGQVGQFGQADRHPVSYLITKIPQLSEISNILKGLCECNVVNGKCNKTRIKIDNKSYTKPEIDNFIRLLNEHKEKIIRHALCGYDKNTEPSILCSVTHEKQTWKKIVFYKMNDIIEYLLTQKFKIRKLSTVVELGSSFTFQRKGGDNGKPSGNDLAFKLVCSKLDIPKEKTLEYIL